MATPGEARAVAQGMLEERLKEQYFQPDVTVDMERLQGASLLPRLFLWPGRATFRSVIWTQVCREGQAVKRPLEAPEVDALSEVAAMQWRIRSWGQPLSVLAAAFFVWKGRATYKIAFRPLRADINPNVFPSAKRQWLKGQRARYAWRIASFGSYAFPCWLMASWVMNEIAVGRGQVKRQHDPRLTQLNAEKKEIVQKALQERFRHMQERQAQGAPMHGQGERPPPRPPLLEPLKNSTNNWNGDSETSSSAASSNAGGSDWGNAGTTSTANTSSLSSYPTSSASPYPQQQQQSPPSYRAPQNNSNGDTGGWGNSPSAFDDDDDDMSPVSPAARKREAASSSGSSWDRIRQQTVSQNGQQQQQQSSEASNWGTNSNTRYDSGAKPGGWGAIRQQNQANTAASTGESYTYSEADEYREKRNYEREKAQKEFDEMVERERQGKGTSGGSSGGGGGWFGRS